MALLQIGGGQKERCAGRVVGIDLGTTYSLVAEVRDGTPRILCDAEGRASLPSVVWYGPDGQTEVGYAARNLAGERAESTIASAKRFMGRSQQEAQVKDEISAYRFESAVDGPVVYFKLPQGRRVTPIEVSADILRELKNRAETQLDGSIDGAVITVPAYFDDAQRQATKDAARLAGLNVLRLLNEPTAAALAYGLDQKREGLFAVFDLGGGTFDLSILKLDQGVFQVLATGGDSRLGGDDFDRIIAEHFLRERGLSAADVSPKRAALALEAARVAKEALTEADTTTLCIEGQNCVLSREQFEALVAPVLARTLAPIRRVLKDVDVAPAELDGVVLVGGVTRVPAVRRFVAEVFQQPPLCDLNPDQVVALGAAVQADILGGGGPRDDVLLLDVLPLSLGLETMGGVVAKILHRNQAIPAAAEQEFTTYADNQTGIDFHVVQGERELVKDCRSLARFQLRGIPPMGAGMARVVVKLSVDADGLLHVSALEKITGIHASVEVKPSYGLDEATIERMLLDSFAHAEADVNEKLFIEYKVEAERIINALERAMQEDAVHLNEPERERLERGVTRLKEAMVGTSHVNLRERIEQLDVLSADFAVARMNRSIQNALGGQKADHFAEILVESP